LDCLVANIDPPVMMAQRLSSVSARWAQMTKQQRLWRQWTAIATILVLLPLSSTYWYVTRWLAKEECLLVSLSSRRGNTTALSAVNNPAFLIPKYELSCAGSPGQFHIRYPFVMDMTSLLQHHPPSIARLVTILAKTKDRGFAVGLLNTHQQDHLKHLQRLYNNEDPQQSAAAMIYDYNPSAGRSKIIIGDLTPHKAASIGNLKALQEIAKSSGRDALFRSDQGGWTPLHQAARGGRFEVVEYLLKQGANVHERTNFGNGSSTLYWAQGYKDNGYKDTDPQKAEKTIELLKSQGAVVIKPGEEVSDTGLAANSRNLDGTANAAGEETTTSRHGFRKNPNKKSDSITPTGTSILPLSTYFWLLANVGLYGWYYTQQVDSSAVSISGKLLSKGGDFGRALSGNLAHFEIWHVGLNMFSLLDLGRGLETETSWVGGTPGLLLWTGSILALATVGVVLLHAIDRRFGTLWRRSEGPSGFPRMVGFSGILFAWSVARTLSLGDQQQVCPVPIFFLSSVCFSTHTLGNGWKFSWGPLFQLLVIQLILNKRVSFVGHLSGTIVGFLWYWGVLPPLELSQPSVLYPLLWMVCKSILYKYSAMAEKLAGTSGDGGGGGGGGQVLGGSGNRWTLSSGCADNGATQSNRPRSQKMRLLEGLQRFGIAHLLWMVFIYRNIESSDNSLVLSELLLLSLYSLFVRATNGNHVFRDRNHPLASIGVLGRAYVAFAVVAVVTDSMSLGGWWATMMSATQMPVYLWFLLGSRFVFWIASSSIVCLWLESSNELQPQSSDESGGIWTHTFGWSIVDPCLSLGKVLVDGSWRKTANWQSASSSSQPEPTSGRSTSNLAGKSRLVDRSNTGARNIV